MKKCIMCKKLQEQKEFLTNKKKEKYSNFCRECRNKKQRLAREKISNKNTKNYEKTHKGFLVRLYRNMQSRVQGVQKQKFHLYQNKELLPRKDFYDWALINTQFIYLFKRWQDSNYDRKLTPSVDRIDSDLGYCISNMEWVTHSENSRRGALSTKRYYNN